MPHHPSRARSSPPSHPFFVQRPLCNLPALLLLNILSGPMFKHRDEPFLSGCAETVERERCFLNFPVLTSYSCASHRQWAFHKYVLLSHRRFQNFFLLRQGLPFVFLDALETIMQCMLAANSLILSCQILRSQMCVTRLHSLKIVRMFFKKF